MWTKICKGWSNCSQRPTKNRVEVRNSWNYRSRMDSYLVDTTDMDDSIAADETEDDDNNSIGYVNSADSIGSSSRITVMEDLEFMDLIMPVPPPHHHRLKNPLQELKQPIKRYSVRLLIFIFLILNCGLNIER